MKSMGPWRGLGIVLIVVGVFTIIIGAVVGSASAESTIDDRYQRTGAPAGVTTWSCGNSDPIQVGRELREELRPKAYTENDGAAYLRTNRRIVIVDHDGNECRIRAEDHNRTYSNGGYIFLGPGFYPSSPAGGSGGSSGSGGGVK